MKNSTAFYSKYCSRVWRLELRRAPEHMGRKSRLKFRFSKRRTIAWGGRHDILGQRKSNFRISFHSHRLFISPSRSAIHSTFGIHKRKNTSPTHSLYRLLHLSKHAHRTSRTFFASPPSPPSPSCTRQHVRTSPPKWRRRSAAS